MHRRRWVTVLLLPLLFVGAAPASAGHGPPVVRTPDGALRGTASTGVESFLGVRYAQPPQRWQPPQPATAWRGVRDATAYGNRCAAAASTNGPESLAEDCLFLNVQRPAGTSARSRLPVYFWIHGGGFTNGSSNQHDGTKIVRQTGVIVVTINYRLGLLGFLAHPALFAAQGDSGNYGFLDQQEALRWVHRNVAAFGGDPRRVTVGGESAGAFSVCGHLAAPGSRGLFAAAILQSGSCLAGTQAGAQAGGVRAATAAGCPPDGDVVACLRATPVERLIATPLFASLVSGGTTLPRPPNEAVAAGDFARVPVVVGANRDEGRTFAQGLDGADRATYEAAVRAEVGPAADAALARYPWPANPGRWTAAYLLGAIITDSGSYGLGGCTDRDLSLTFARWVPTYAYQFDHRTGPGLLPLPGFVWGAGHAAELAYFWPSFDNGVPIAPTFDAGERRLARDMVQWWGQFVRAGRPGTVDGVRWPRFRDGGQVLSLRAGGRSTLITDAQRAAQHRCGFWSTVL